MAYHAHVLDGRAVFVTHVGTHFGQRLAVTFGEHGANVATTAGRFADRARADAAFAGTRHLDVLVHVVVDDDALVAQPLSETAPDAWDERGEALLRDALFTFQAAHERFVAAGAGRIVVVAPTSGFTGAGGFVPYSTAVEGIRALAKSTARSWAPLGITVNSVLVPPALVAPQLAAATTFAAPPVVGRLPDLHDDVAATIAHFAAPTSSGITGSTVIVDGGTVMAP
jgi:3-oxoacyl-[acyl-carrier protein] reductase